MTTKVTAAIQITPDFTIGEFVRAEDAVPRPEYLDNLYMLANRLQVIRDLLGKKITINSGFRTPEHNAEIGGEKNSYHLRGMAADIVIEGMPPKAVQAYLKNWNGGLGSYDGWTHVDLGPKRRWQG